MADKIYTPDVIEDAPFPQEEVGVVFTESQTKTDGTENPATIKDQPKPYVRVSRETIASSLNTKSKKILGEFTFTENGAIRVGEYSHGISGDVRITPNGITARDESGVTTFSIDGTTGNAVFKGEVQAGAIITGNVEVGDGDIIIDGADKRLIFYDPDTGLASIVIGNI